MINATISGTGTTGTGTTGLSNGVGILGSVLQVASSIYGISLQKKMSNANANLYQAQGNYESAVSEFNAAVARANAEAIRTSADLDIERMKTTAGKVKSSQVAGYAKSGVQLKGSPLDIMIDSAQQAKLDIAIIDYNANIGVMQAKTQAKQYETSGQISKVRAESSAKLLRTSGKFQQEQGYIKGAQLLLSTVSSYSR
jgi:hypothetical protein